MTKPYEFDCIDCGVHVFLYPLDTQRDRCGTCQWISELPEKDREAARAIMIDLGVLDRKGVDAAGLQGAIHKSRGQ